MKSSHAEGIAAAFGQTFLRCAVYARKSTDDNDKAAEDKSVERQIAHARAYIGHKGWRLAGEEHVYVDDGISGAVFKNRPALLRMLNNLKEFDAIVISEQSRLGREQSQISGVLAKIVTRGVRIFCYLDDKEVRYESAVDKFMVNAISFANEMERELAAQRARDAALKRARESRNFGGRVFGYTNVWRLKDGSEHPAPPGEPKPSGAQTLYRINEDEAEVVRGICRMFADGYGQKSIAFALNGAPSHLAELRKYFTGRRPTPPRGQAACWSPNTIHDILRNPRYLGFVPYGATRKTLNLEHGTKRRVRGEEQLFPAPELRIIDERLATAVKERVEKQRRSYLRLTGGKFYGRPESGRASKYWLSGILRCKECGSSMIASASSTGSGARRRHQTCYRCNFRSNRGPTACSNALRPLMVELDEKVRAAIEEQTLTPAVIRAAAKRAAELIREQQRSQPDAGPRMRRHLAKAERERNNLVSALAGGRAKPEAVLAAIADRERQIETLRRALAELESPPLLDQLSDKRMERALFERATYWREALRGEPVLGRQALRKLLDGPIWFVPEEDGGYRLEGATKLGALWPENASEITGFSMASPRGFEPRLPP